MGLYVNMVFSDLNIFALPWTISLPFPLYPVVKTECHKKLLMLFCKYLSALILKHCIINQMYLFLYVWHAFCWSSKAGFWVLQMFSEGLKFIDKSVKKLLKPHAGWVLKVAARAKCLWDGLLLCLYIELHANWSSVSLGSQWLALWLNQRIAPVGSLDLLVCHALKEGNYWCWCSVSSVLWHLEFLWHWAVFALWICVLCLKKQWLAALLAGMFSVFQWRVAGVFSDLNTRWVVGVFYLD